MRKSPHHFLSLILSLTLTACGGGGGGGGGSSSTTGVRILHGAIDGPPVELVTDTALDFQTARYGEAGSFRELGKGQHLLTLFTARTRTTNLFSRSISNSGNQKFTVLFYGNRDALGLQAQVIAEDVPTVPAGASLVRAIHAVGGASTVDFVVGTGSAGASFGAASPFVELAPGEHPFLVRRSADRLVLARGTVLVEEGRAYTVFAGGEAGYLVTTQVIEE